MFYIELSYVDELFYNVYIIKLMDYPFIFTRCMDVSLSYTHVTFKDSLFCMFFHEKDHTSINNKGVVPLVPKPSSHSLITHFNLDLCFKAGIVTNIHGQLIGVHACSFNIQEGDFVDHNALVANKL